MTKTPMLKLAVALTLFSAAATTQAQDAGALVDKLVKKGVLTDQEAEEVRADMMRDFSQTSAGKININSSVTEMKLYGDLRLRYQYDDREAQVAAPNHVDQRSRWRYRLRLGADVTLGENWFAGFQLQTGPLQAAGKLWVRWLETACIVAALGLTSVFFVAAAMLIYAIPDTSRAPLAA